MTRYIFNTNIEWSIILLRCCSLSLLQKVISLRQYSCHFPFSLTLLHHPRKDSVLYHLFIKVTYNDKVHQCVNTADIQNNNIGEKKLFFFFFKWRFSWWWVHRFESRGSVGSASRSASSLAQPMQTWRSSLVAVSHMTPRCSRTCARTISSILQWPRFRLSNHLKRWDWMLKSQKP